MMKRYCEYCGKKMKKQDDSFVLTSNPPQYMYKCKKGHTKYYCDFTVKQEFPKSGSTFSLESMGGWANI